MIQAKAILVTGVGQVTVGAAEVPEPGPGEVLVEAAFSCISPGTELRCFAGEQPGSENVPYIPGYAMTGTVAAVGADVQVPVGTPVFCGGTRKVNHHRLWGAHISHAVMEEGALFPLPDGLGLKEASVAALASIAYHGIRLSRTQPHEKVAVVGLGAIGQLSARLHAITGAQVVGADLAPSRVEALKAAGVGALVPQGSLAESFRTVFPEGADVIVDATGSPGVLPHALEIARELSWDDRVLGGPRYLVQGSYADSFSIPYNPAFQREMTFLVPRNRQRIDGETVISLMAQGKLNVADLITQTLPPEECATAYADLQNPESGALTIAFQWR
ncbi:MAG: hypothetical protein OHK0029_41910 [Armatimonadaceae bacterium]